MKTVPSISFVLPMFNEQDNIVKTIEEIKSIADGLTDEYEIIITDDASTDRSADIVEGIAKEDTSVKLYRLKSNTKFGGAFAECFKHASKEIILYMDSDMPVETKDIKESLPLIHDADIVTGYNKFKKGDTLRRKFISGVYNMLIQLMFGLNIKDINSGYKIVRRDIVKGVELISRSPFVDVELFLRAKLRNARVKQFPLVFRQRTGGKSYISSLPIIMATFRDMIKIKAISGRWRP